MDSNCSEQPRGALGGAQPDRRSGEHRTMSSLRRVQPEIHLGPLELKTFGICFALAFLAAGGVLARRLREIGRPSDWSYEIIFAGLVGGVVGARLNYIAQNWDTVSHDLVGNVFSGSGLVWYGGAVGGAIGVVLWARRRDFVSLALLDVTAGSPGRGGGGGGGGGPGSGG